MIIDITGIMLMLGRGGKDCPGNEEIMGIECCCDECDYLICCLETHNPKECTACSNRACPCAASLSLEKR